MKNKTLLNKTLLSFARRAGALAGLTVFLASGAMAQASAPLALPELAASAASSPGPASRTPPGPRLRSAAETGQGATAPGDLRPERPVAPQINVPLGRRPVAPESDSRPVRRPAAPPVAGGIDDAAARCESQEDDRARSSCRARTARESRDTKPRAPN